MPLEFSLLTFCIISLSFLLAGTVKGMVGVGIVAIPVALLTVAFDLATAMVLLLVPSFLTNVWQACAGPYGRILLRLLWPFLVAATIPIWLGAMVRDVTNLTLMSGILGAVLVVYGALNLMGARLSVADDRLLTVAPYYGAANGFLTGMTGAFVVPGVMYLQAMGLKREAMIQAMGMLFTVSSIGLGLAIWQYEGITPELGIISALAMVPVTIGMRWGQQIRHTLSETGFRRVFFASMFLLGVYILAMMVAEFEMSLI